MRIALVYCDVGAPSRRLVTTELAVLQQMLLDAHHDVQSIAAAWFDRLDNMLSQPDGEQFDLLAFRLDEWNWPVTRQAAALLRAHYPKAPFVGFGTYATLAPEAVLRSGTFDFLVAGEPEPAFFELASVLERGSDPATVRNLWWARSAGEVIRNPLRPPLDSLDSLPLTQHAANGATEELPPDDHPLYMWASRGCPFECTFCYLPVVQRAYQGKGEYYRTRSPVHVASELLGKIRRSPCTRIVFVDELFPASKTWLRGFQQHLHGLQVPPWEATVAAETVDVECLALLRDTGCRHLHIGIETGSEAFRRRFASRNLSNQQLQAFCSRARDHGISVTAHIMVALPLESEPLLTDTVSFVQQLAIDEIAWRPYFPIDKTPLGEYCRPRLPAEDALLAHPGTAARQIVFGEESLDALRGAEQQLDRINLSRACDALPPAPLGAALDLLGALPQAQITAPASGRVRVRVYAGVGGTVALCELRPTASVTFQEIALPAGTILRLRLAVSARTQRYLAATRSSARLEIACSTEERRVVLFQTRFDGSSPAATLAWQELLLPLPGDVSSGRLTFVCDALRPEDEEVIVWIAEPVLVQKSTLLQSRDAEQKLRSEAAGELEALRAQVAALEVQLTDAQERERKLKEDAERKAHRIMELQTQMLEIEKQCDELERRLVELASRKPLWARALALLRRGKH
jgi:hypothetical protein